ncbi:MAG TPA: DUF4272 domain-containing protein [Acidobacteriaceae bacterium]|nr:DUF4272 domain-containing protein [Acidobacteriaceae bacterium]
MNLPEEAVTRRARSLEILAREAVPFMPQLPVIETSTEIAPRSKEEIAYRTHSLLTVALKGEGLSQPIVKRILQERSLKNYLTQKELAFIENSDPSQHERIQFSWRYECVWVLLWALGYIEELNRPERHCDVGRIITIMKEPTNDEFIARACQRPLSEILDAADLIYRYHWAVVSTRLRGEPAPARLDKGVVMERHHALNWLIRYMDQDWDDISTDT